MLYVCVNLDDTDEEDSVYEMVNKAYLDAVFILLLHMIGVKQWETMGRESKGESDQMVTRSDEALLMWAMDCYWNVVAVNDCIRYDEDLRPDKAPYYIPEAGVTRKNMGWTQTGETKYNEYYMMVDSNRKDEYWYIPTTPILTGSLPTPPCSVSLPPSSTTPLPGNVIHATTQLLLMI